MKKSVLFLLLFLQAMSLSIAGEDLATAYPAGTLVYMEINTTGASVKDYDQTAFAQMFADERCKPFFDQMGGKITELLTNLSPLTMGADLKSLISGFGQRFSYGGTITDDKKPDFILQIAFAPEKMAADLLGGAFPKNDQNELVLSFPMDKREGINLHIQTSKNRLLLQVNADKSTLAQSITGYKDGLAASKKFQQSAKQLGEGKLLFLYVDVDSALDKAQKLAGEKHKGELRTIPAQWGLHPQTSIFAYSINIDKPGFLQKRYTALPAGVTFENKVPSCKTASFIPADSSMYSCSEIDILNLLKTYIQVLKPVMDKSTPKEIAQLLTEKGELNIEHIKQLSLKGADVIGADVWQGLLTQAGGEYALFLQPTDTISGANLFGLSGFGCVVEVKDKGKVDKALESIFSKNAKHLKNISGRNFSMKASTGEEIRGIAFTNTLVLCYCLSENYLILAANPFGIERCLKMHKDGKTLAQGKSFASLREQIAQTAKRCGIQSEPLSLTRLELDGISQLANNLITLPAIIGGGALCITQKVLAGSKRSQPMPNILPFPNPQLQPAEFIQYFGDMFPLYLLPPIDVINSRMFNTWTARFNVSAGEQVELEYGPMPVLNQLLAKHSTDSSSFVTIAGVGVVAAMLSGPLMNARTTALWANAASNLKMIGTACFVYEQENDKSPAKLEDLLGEFLDEKALRNPVGGDEEIGFSLIGGLNKKTKPNQIIALSKPIDADGGVVLFRDGHVRHVQCSAEEYTQLYEALMQNKNRPVIERWLPECSNATKP